MPRETRLELYADCQMDGGAAPPGFAAVHKPSRHEQQLARAQPHAAWRAIGGWSSRGARGSERRQRLRSARA